MSKKVLYIPYSVYIKTANCPGTLNQKMNHKHDQPWSYINLTKKGTSEPHWLL